MAIHPKNVVVTAEGINAVGKVTGTRNSEEAA